LFAVRIVFKVVNLSCHIVMNPFPKFFLGTLIVLAVAGLYAPSLHHAVFFDDKNFFEQSGLNFIFQKGFVFEPRWLPYFITAWIELIFTDALFAQRVINVGLHLLTGFVLYALVKQVTSHVAPHRNNGRAALAAALLFLLHPLAVYAVGYLIQRTILMATLFGLLTLNTYFDALVTRNKAYFGFAALFYLLSAFSKQHAVLVPLAALALTPLAVPLTRQTVRQLILPFALFVPIAVLVIIKSSSTVGQVYEPFAEQLVQLQGGDSSAGMMWVLSVMTQAALYFKYLLLAFVPNPDWMSIDMRPPFASSLTQPKYVLAVLALAVYGVAALSWLLKGGRRGLVGFALLAPLLLFAVEFSTVRIQEPFVLYRAYLWIPPLFLLIPVLTNGVSAKWFWPALLVVAAAFFMASSNRLQSFSSEFALWDDAVLKLSGEMAQGSARTYRNRGYLNMRRGDREAAITDLNRALKVDPSYKKAYQNRAFIYMYQGKFELALQDVNTVLRTNPNDPNNLALRGMIYRRVGRFDEAIADFRRACELHSVSACSADHAAREYTTRNLSPR
jgi:hypothetical protein